VFLLKFLYIFDVSLETLCVEMKRLVFVLPLLALQDILNYVFFEIVAFFLLTQNCGLNNIVVGELGSGDLAVAE
jgi:hypothetical protein